VRVEQELRQHFEDPLQQKPEKDGFKVGSII
jgi:hypothetical protein